MYHVGKVKRLIKPEIRGVAAVDQSIQATVAMFDAGLINVTVHPALQDKIKVNDYVLIRFASPEETIIKILPKKLGEEIFQEFKKLKEKRSEKKHGAAQTLHLELPKPEKPIVGDMVR